MGAAADRESQLATVPGEDAPQRAALRLAAMAIACGGAAGVAKIRSEAPITFAAQPHLRRSTTEVVHMSINTTRRLVAAGASLLAAEARAAAG